MSTRTIQIDEALHAYLLGTVREAPLLARLRAETARLSEANMQISPEQGAFMRLLVETLQVHAALEIGTFTGYSAICVAAALPADGRLVCCDVSRAWTDIARRYWQEAGVAARIDLRLGPALDTLAGLEQERGTDSFDFAFIDADKRAYPQYYETCLRLVRPGGLILLDNALRGGRVLAPAADDADTQAIAGLNTRIPDDARVTASLVPIGDGLWLIRKR